MVDPNLSASLMVALFPMIVAMYGVGRLVDSRGEMVARLGRHNEELRQQQQRRAEMADVAQAGARRWRLRMIPARPSWR